MGSKKKTGEKSVKASSKATEKARREALAVTKANIDRIDAGLDPDALQVTCIDVDHKTETAAAKAHFGGDGTTAPKAARKPRAPKPPKEKRVSALDAAAKVLARCDKPKAARELIEMMAEQGLWKSPGGKTPDATLYAAMVREITVKGKEARFKKVDRGLFLAA
jgi:hypothetical protein